MRAVDLTVDHVILQPYSQVHDRSTVTWLNSRELRESFGITQTITLESHRTWIESLKDTIIWAICVADRGHCGNVLVHCNRRHHSGYFQIYLGDKKARGNGVGRRTLQAVLDHLFFELDLHRVWLHTLLDNTAAEQLYVGAGFVSEGIERESILRSGHFASQHRWSILANEWRQRRGKEDR